jgi:hypothetical protein
VPLVFLAFLEMMVPTDLPALQARLALLVPTARMVPVVLLDLLDLSDLSALLVPTAQRWQMSQLRRFPPT